MKISLSTLLTAKFFPKATVFLLNQEIFIIPSHLLFKYTYLTLSITYGFCGSNYIYAPIISHLEII